MSKNKLFVIGVMIILLMYASIIVMARRNIINVNIIKDQKQTICSQTKTIEQLKRLLSVPVKTDENIFIDSLTKLTEIILEK